MTYKYVYETINNVAFNQFQTFYIYSEPALAMTGQKAEKDYHFHGKIKAVNFKDACRRLANIDEHFRRYYDDEKMTFWSCPLVDRVK